MCNLLYSEVVAIAPLSYRHVFSIALLFFLLIQKGESLKIDKYFGLFLIFVVFWGLGAIITGHAIEFMNKLFGSILNAYVLYQSTKYLIHRFDGIHFLIGIILVIGTIDGIVTIFQYYDMPYGYLIPKALRIEFIEEFEEYSNRRYAYGDSALVIPGLMGGARHGYFLSCAVLLSLYPIKGKMTIFNLSLWALTSIGLLFVQERAVFYLTLLGSVYSIICLVGLTRDTKNRGNFLFNVLILLGVLYFVYMIFRMSQGGGLRYTVYGSNLLGREDYMANALRYVWSNPMGGYFEFANSGNRPPHNLFINAMIWGGVIGGLIVSIMVIIQVFVAIKAVILNVSKNTYTTFLFGVIFLLYTANSMLHNESVVTGFVYPWIYWAAFASNLSKKSEINENLYS